MHPGLFQELLNQINLETNRMIFDDVPQEEQPQANSAANAPPKPVGIPVTAAPRIGRNDLCPCNSGKKYKKCCGLSEEPV